MQFYSIIDDLINSIRAYTQSGLDQFVDIKAALANSEYTWITRDGTLASAIRVDGTFIDAVHTPDYLDFLEGELRALLVRYGVEVKVIFDYGGREHASEIHREGEVYKKNLDKLANLGWLYEDILKTYTQWTYKESTYIIIYSTLNSFSRELISLNKRNKQKLNGDKENMSFEASPTELFAYHEGRVIAFMNAITASRNIMLSAKRMKLKEVIEVNRRRFFPETSHEWNAEVPGERKRYFHAQEGKHLPHKISQKQLFSYFGAASVAKQVFDMRIDDDRQYPHVSGDMVQIGDYVHQAIMIDKFQSERRNFQDLFNRLNKLDVPWSFTLHLKAVDESMFNTLKYKRFITNMLTYFDGGGMNELVDSWDYLVAVKNEKRTIIEISGGLSFSASVHDAKNLTANISQAEGALTGWGNTTISRKQAEKLYMLMSVGSIGLCRNTPGAKAFAPIDEVIQMLPLTRPARPYQRGSLPMRTIDGKYMPIALTTSEVGKNRSTITAAPPRFGKSLFMAIRALCVIAESTTGKLPYLSFFDIGASSRGLIETLRSSLDVDKKHEVFHYDMDTSKQSTINMFDTPLGVRIPTTEWITAITNTITLLCTAEQDAPAGLRGLLTSVVRKAYREKHDDSIKANIYSSTQDAKIHDWLMVNEYPLDDKTIWWEIVDHLISKKEYNLAKRAQTYAVPRLDDLIPVLSDPEFDHDGAETVPGTNTSVPQYVANRIKDAIGQFDFINGATKLDVGMSRIISVDFLQVKNARGGGSSIVLVLAYLLVLWQVYSRFAFDLGSQYKQGITPESRSALEEMLGKKNVEHLFKYHVDFFEDAKNDFKEMIVDEAHEMNSAGDNAMTVFKNQLISMIRNGPKFNQAISLISQQIEDFMGKVSKEGAVQDNFAQLIDVKQILNMRFDKTKEKKETIRSYFEINDQQIDAMANTKMPGKSGSNVWYISRTDGQVYVLDLYNTLPPSAIWINTSSNESRIIRERLTKRIGFANTIKTLAKYFPLESDYTTFLTQINDMVLLNSNLDLQAIHKEFIESLVEDDFKKERFLNR